VLKIIRDLIIDNKIVSYVIDFAKGREHETWKCLLGLAFYYYTIGGPTQWSHDSYQSRLPKSMAVLLHISYSMLVDMRQCGVPWEHTCGVSNVAQCVSRWLEVLDDATKSYYGRRKSPADFAGWVRAVVGRYSHRYTACQKIAVSKYEAQASVLEAGSWEFFEKLQW